MVSIPRHPPPALLAYIHCAGEGLHKDISMQGIMCFHNICSPVYHFHLPLVSFLPSVAFLMNVCRSSCMWIKSRIHNREETSSICLSLTCFA